MNKLFTKIATAFVGIAMAIGVGVAIGSNSDVRRADAANSTATYTVSTTTSVTSSGTLPTGSSATYSQTYGTKEQATKGNSFTLTLSGYDGCTIKGLVLNMKSNKSSGAGYMSFVTGSTTMSSIGSANSGVAFNNSKWHGSWSTSFVDVTPAWTTDGKVATNGSIVLTIGATANSLFFHSATITYEAGGDTPTDSVTLSVDKDSIDLDLYDKDSDTFNVSISATGSYGTEFIVESDDENVATVSPDVGDGDTTITVSAVGTGDCTITVTSYSDLAKTATVNVSVSDSTPSEDSFVIKLDNSGASGKSGYDSGAERTSTINNVGFGNKATMASSSQTGCIQLQATNGIIYNTTALPSPISSITMVQQGTNRAMTLQAGSQSRLVNDTAADYTITGGSTSGITAPSTASSMKWTFAENTNYTFFALKINAGNAAHVNSITIELKPASTEKTVELSKTFGSKVMLAKNNASKVITGLSASSQNITNPIYKWEIVNPTVQDMASITGTGATPTFTVLKAGALEIKVSARASADPDTESSYTACAYNISLTVEEYGGTLSWQSRANTKFKEGAGFDLSSTTITLTLKDDTVITYNNDYSALNVYMGDTSDSVALVTPEIIATITSDSYLNNKFYKIVDSNYEIGSSITQIATVSFEAKAAIQLSSVANLTEITKNQTIYLKNSISEGWGGDTVTYTSSSNAVSVDSNGVVKSGDTAINNVTITATLTNGNSATFSLNVLESKTYDIEEAYAMVSGFNTLEEDMYYGSSTAGQGTEQYVVKGFYCTQTISDTEYVCLCDDPLQPTKILKLFNCSGSDITFEQGEIITASGTLNDYQHHGNYYLCDGELISHEMPSGDRVVDFENTTVTPEQGTTSYSFGATFDHPGTIHIAYIDGFSRDVSLSNASISANMKKLGSQTVSVYVNDYIYSGNDNLLVGTYTIDITNVGASYVIPGFSAVGENFTRASLSADDSKWKQSGAGSDYAAQNKPYLLKMDNSDDYIEYVFAEGETNNASSYSCSVSLKKIGGANNSSFNLVGVDSEGNPITGVSGSTSSATGAQNTTVTVSGTLTNSNNAQLSAIRFVFVKGSNVGVSGATITSPEEAKTDLINAQDDAYAEFLSGFKSCESGWSSRDDIVKLVTEYNAMHSTAKSAFELLTITDFDWTKTSEYDISTHEYTGGDKTLSGVSAIEKLKLMVDIYNKTLKQGETKLVLQTPSGNFSNLSSFNLLIVSQATNTSIIVIVTVGIAAIAIGGYFLLRKKKED